jgi:hypothetical protein
MIVPLLVLIAVGLVTYAGFLKLAACLLRYSVSWKSSFLFAGIMMIAVISSVVWWHLANGADVCNDACGGISDRYSGSDFVQQAPFRRRGNRLMKIIAPLATSQS